MTNQEIAEGIARKATVAFAIAPTISNEDVMVLAQLIRKELDAAEKRGWRAAMAHAVDELNEHYGADGHPFAQEFLTLDQQWRRG